MWYHNASRTAMANSHMGMANSVNVDSKPDTLTFTFTFNSELWLSTTVVLLQCCVVIRCVAGRYSLKMLIPTDQSPTKPSRSDTREVVKGEAGKHVHKMP